MRLLACADTETETDTDVNLPTACAPAPAPADRPGWARAYAQVREHTARLAAGLSAEDQALQSMPETSPTKWHLAHTTWFFEALLLLAHAPGYQAVNARWAALFNSYYESLGPRHPRPQRGLLSRPSLDEVRHYRRQVDEAVQRFIATAPEPTWLAAVDTLTLGLHHEQQHQELLLTDILHAFSLNPLQPAYAVVAPQARSATPTGAAGNRRNRAPARWVNVDAGLVQVGHPGDGFAFDNERPRHATPRGWRRTRWPASW